jgi:hypothetical protein
MKATNQNSRHENHNGELNLPVWLGPPFQQFHRHFKNERRFLHLGMQGLSQVSHAPGLLEMAFKVLKEKPDHDAQQAEKTIEKAREDANWTKSEIDTGFPILHSHFVVALWSTVEVFCEDLAVAWLGNTPEAWKKEEISRLKIEVGTYHTMDDEERARYIIDCLSRSLGAPLKSGVTRLDDVLGVFGLTPSVGPNVRKALHELCQVRNAIVHSGGVADERLIRECPWLGLKTNDRLQIPHLISGWYGFAVDRYVERVLNQILVVLGYEGCKCPGMDEIPERPQVLASETG